METIRPVIAQDIMAVCALFNFYVQNTTHTFALETSTEAEALEKMQRIVADYPFLVAVQDGQLLGYAHLNRYRSRAAYNHVAETSIYIQPSHQGHGIGTRLYKALLDQAPQHQVFEVIGVIALPNEASERMHQNLGFHKVGVFPRMGYKFNKWIDTAYWQLSLTHPS